MVLTGSVKDNPGITPIHSGFLGADINEMIIDKTTTVFQSKTIEIWLAKNHQLHRENFRALIVAESMQGNSVVSLHYISLFTMGFQTHCLNVLNVFDGISRALYITAGIFYFVIREVFIDHYPTTKTWEGMMMCQVAPVFDRLQRRKCYLSYSSYILSIDLGYFILRF